MSRLYPVLVLVLIANITLADWTAEVVTDTNQVPYKYTGRLAAERWVGSGVVVGDERSVVTAAHVLFDNSSLSWLSQIDWRIRNEGSTRTLRNIRYLADYADLVEDPDASGAMKFNSDMAVVFSYEALSDGGFGEIAHNVDTAVTSGNEKMVTGFPSGNYDQSHPDRHKMHRTGPFTAAFDHAYQQYYGLINATLGPGGSGGGVWVKDGGDWKYAATYVAGLSKANGAEYNSMGVVALGGNKKSLLDDVFVELGLYHLPEITLQPPETIHGNLDEDTLITVQYTSEQPILEAIWEYKDPQFPEHGFQRLSHSLADWSVSSSETILTIPSRSYLMHGAIFRVLVRNRWGGTYCREVQFMYDLPPLPKFTMQPKSQVLRNNATAVLEARINLHQDATLHWERKPYGSSEFSQIASANKTLPRLNVSSASGYHNGDQYRLVAFDGIRTFYSDTATLTWADVGLREALLLEEPPDFLFWGDSGYIEVGMKGTAYCTYSWRFTDPDGQPVSRPPGLDSFAGSYGADSKLWVRNIFKSLNGIKVEAIANRTYYEQQPGGNERVEEQVTLFTWTLKASGPSTEISNYHVSYDEDLHQVSAAVVNFEVEPHSVSWQASSNAGVRWHPLDSDPDGILKLNLNDKLEQGTAIRALIKQDDGNIIHTRRIPINVGSTQTIAKIDAESTPIVYLTSGMALSPDSSTIAYGQYDGSRPLRILESNGDYWQETAEIELDGFTSNGLTEIEFISNTRILVSLPWGDSGDALSCGKVVEIVKQADGQWLAGEPIILPAPATHDLFANRMDYENGYIIASIRDEEVPFRILRLDNDEWKLCEVVGVPPDAYRSMRYTSHVIISGDTAIAMGYNLCLYLKRSNDDTWEYKDSLVLRQIFAPVYLQPNGNIVVYDQSRFYLLANFEEWTLNSQGRLEKVPSATATFGAPKAIFRPCSVASYNGLHGMVNDFDSFGSNVNSAFLVKQDPTTGEFLVATIRTEPEYKIQYISISEEYIALQIDNKEVGQEDGAWWQVWLIPIDELEFELLDSRIWPVNLEASLVQSGQAMPVAKLRFRESINPPIPIKIQSSRDGMTWIQLRETDFDRTVLDPDIDGDNQTALIELSVPLEAGDKALLLRAVEE
ncbi:MAG: trypsin-like peptidase domain-containing protein [Puniceicoccaceae bacterium]